MHPQTPNSKLQCTTEKKIPTFVWYPMKAKHHKIQINTTCWTTILHFGLVISTANIATPFLWFGIGVYFVYRTKWTHRPNTQHNLNIIRHKMLQQPHTAQNYKLHTTNSKFQYTTQNTNLCLVPNESKAPQNPNQHILLDKNSPLWPCFFNCQYLQIRFWHLV